MLAASNGPKRTRRRLHDDGEAPREQHVADECPRCGAARLVTPCSGCPAWFVVCDCLASGVPLYECYLADDRCVRCRRATARAERRSVQRDRDTLDTYDGEEE